MVLTRRRLPHLYLGNTPLSLTWHLYGSLPHKLYPPPGKQNSGQAFVWMDRYLDSARTGPVFLRQEAIARLLVESIRYNAEQLRYFDLQAFAIMPNHVHLLGAAEGVPEPVHADSEGLHGATSQPVVAARRPAVLADRIVRPLGVRPPVGPADQGLHREQPVKAGLAAQAEEYPWSSADPRWKAETTLGSASLAACATPVDVAQVNAYWADPLGPPHH